MGRKSSTVEVLFTNINSTPLTISSIAVTGSNATDFEQRNNCGTGLAPGAKCTIQMMFKPNSSGQLTAAVSISDSAATQPQMITLKGSGFP